MLDGHVRGVQGAVAGESVAVQQNGLLGSGCGPFVLVEVGPREGFGGRWCPATWCSRSCVRNAQVSALIAFAAQHDGVRAAATGDNCRAPHGGTRLLGRRPEATCRDRLHHGRGRDLRGRPVRRACRNPASQDRRRSAPWRTGGERARTLGARSGHADRIEELDAQIAVQERAIATVMAATAIQAAQQELDQDAATQTVTQATGPMNVELGQLRKLREEAVA